jgi:nicotinamidase-related amidase
MSGHERLDAARTCLLLFDLLEGHVNKDEASRTRFRPVIADRGTSARTIRDTDNRLRPLRAGDSESHQPLLTGGTEETRVVRELSPRPADYLVPKHRWSAFHGTYLDLALRTRGANTIILCGGSTDVGVAATAFAARDLDYSLVIASDACTSPEQDNHDQLMRRVFPRMGRVRTTAQVIAMLRSRSAARRARSS